MPKFRLRDIDKDTHYQPTVVKITRRKNKEESTNKNQPKRKQKK